MSPTALNKTSSPVMRSARRSPAPEVSATRSLAVAVCRMKSAPICETLIFSCATSVIAPFAMSNRAFRPSVPPMLPVVAVSLSDCAFTVVSPAAIPDPLTSLRPPPATSRGVYRRHCPLICVCSGPPGMSRTRTWSARRPASSPASGRPGLAARSARPSQSHRGRYRPTHGQASHRHQWPGWPVPSPK